MCFFGILCTFFEVMEIFELLMVAGNWVFIRIIVCNFRTLCTLVFITILDKFTIISIQKPTGFNIFIWRCAMFPGEIYLSHKV